MGKIPAYKIMYQKLKDDINNDVYPVGSFLPPEGDLEKMFNVSRTTVRHAIDLLVREGHIRVRQGFGTQVVNIEGKELHQYSKFHNVIDVKTDIIFSNNVKNRGIWIDKVSANPKVANAIQIEPGEQVFCLQRVIYSDNTPMILMTNYLRIDFFPDLDSYRDQFDDLYYFLQKHYDITFISGQERINTIRADYMDAQLLGISPGSPIFFNTRIAYCDLGPLEYLEAKIRPDLCTFVVEMQGPPKWYGDSKYVNELI